MLKIIIRSIIMFFTLFIIVKIIGKKQIKNLTLYDYILSITIGSITADSIISIDTPLYYGIIALTIFSLIGYITSILSYHNHELEKVVEGNPLVLYENNNFIYQNMDNAKLTMAKFLENCRLKGCFNIKNIDKAILEPSGDISLLLKNKQSNLLNYLLIIDGMINEKELHKAHKTKTWLTKYLNSKNLNINNVALLVIDTNDKISLYKKD